MTVNVSVVSPRRQFGDIETFHWWEVDVEGQQVSISASGHFCRPSTGGDTFTTMSWTAWPGNEPDFADYRDHLAIVPDVMSFEDAVAALDLSDTNYKIRVEDYDNPLLEECSEEEPQDEEDSETEGSER
jgi:hypothetical protein